MLRFTRLAFAALGLAIAAGLSPLAPPSAEAQVVTQIRYFVAPNPANPTELFEVIDGAAGGGRLIRDGRREYIPGPSAGISVGFSNRASRGEGIVTQVLGSGVARLEVRSGGRALVTLSPVSLPTPGNRQMVSSNPSVDNISVAALTLGGGLIKERRLPVGTRP